MDSTYSSAATRTTSSIGGNDGNLMFGDATEFGLPQLRDLLAGTVLNGLAPSDKGDDHLFGGNGQDILVGGHGRDCIFGSNGLNAGFGDALTVGTGNSAELDMLGGLPGGATFSQPFLKAALALARVEFDQTPLPDTFYADVYLGGLNDDVAFGGIGNDLLFGRAGTDWAFGGPGTDTAADFEQTFAAESTTDPGQLGFCSIGSISGSVFHDRNLNGQYDPSENNLEEPVAGQTVYLHNAAGEIIAETLSGDEGTFAFTVAAGTYSLSQKNHPKYQQTTPLPIAPRSTFVVEAGRSSTPYDFGVLQRMQLGGAIYEDLNGDGIRQKNETGSPVEPGFPNVD